LAHQAHTPFELFAEKFADSVKKFFKRMGIRLTGFGETVGTARAAQHLCSINEHAHAKQVVLNHLHSAEARQRLLRQLK